MAKPSHAPEHAIDRFSKVGLTRVPGDGQRSCDPARPVLVVCRLAAEEKN
jgi:hypothetical protein